MINEKTQSTGDLGYACPFSIDDYAGMYVATTDEFGIYLSNVVPFEVIVGPGENQITLVDVAAHPEMYDIVVDVDPATGDLTVPKQPALNYNNFGATQYGELRWEGTGSSGTAGGFCIGELSITAAYTVETGRFIWRIYNVFFKIGRCENTDTDTKTIVQNLYQLFKESRFSFRWPFHYI